VAVPRERMDVGAECQPERVNMTAESDYKERRASLQWWICWLEESQGRMSNCGGKMRDGKGSESSSPSATMQDLLQLSDIIL